MNVEALQTYYANLLIMQYRGKPKASAEIKSLVYPVIMNQLPAKIQEAFNLDSAVGRQLDTLGKYAGVVRTANFASGPVPLTDDDFRTLIKMAILTNNSDGTLQNIELLLSVFFPGEIYVTDFQNMRLSYLISSTVGSQTLAKFFIAEGLLPKPMGVHLAQTIYVPNPNNLFGFRTYQAPAANASPFNSVQNYHLNYPWLSYAQAITL